MKTSTIVRDMKKEYLKENDYLCLIAAKVTYSHFNKEESECYRYIIKYINKAIEYESTVRLYLIERRNKYKNYNSYYNHYNPVTEEECHKFRLQLLDEMIDFFTKEENDHEF